MWQPARIILADRYTEIENCVNEGDNVNAFATVNSARIGSITCIYVPEPRSGRQPRQCDLPRQATHLGGRRLSGQ